MNDFSNKSQTIFFPLWRGFSIRLFSRPDTIQLLINKGYKVVFLVPSTNDKKMLDSLEKMGVILEPLELDKLNSVAKSRLGSFFFQTRAIIYGQRFAQKMETNAILKKTFWQVTRSGNSFRSWINYFYDLFKNWGNRFIAFCASRSLLIRKVLLGIESYLISPKFHRDLYLKYHPKLVVLPSLGYSLDSVLMREAKAFGATVFSYVQSWDNLTTKGYGGAKADFVGVWNEINRQEAIDHHDINPNQIIVGGVPHWDNYFSPEIKINKADFFKAYNLDPAKKTILYGWPDPKLYRKNADIIQFLLEGIKNDTFSVKSQLLIRLHPTHYMKRNAPSEIKEDLDLISLIQKQYPGLVGVDHPVVLKEKNVFVIDASDVEVQKSLLSYSNVLICVYSTMMIEASIFDLPTVTIGFDKYRHTDMEISVYNKWEHIKKPLQTGAIPVAYSLTELYQLINRFLMDPSYLSNNRKKLSSLMAPVHRGTAGKNLGHLIESSASDSWNYNPR